MPVFRIQDDVAVTAISFVKYRRQHLIEIFMLTGQPLSDTWDIFDMEKMMTESLLWEKLDSEFGPELPLFKVRLDTLRHPTSSKEFQRLVLEAPEWVNVVAVTIDQKIVMVEQYRFGVGELTIEPVGGLVDPGEDSLQAAKRELLEESGFGNGRWSYLGSVQANPAIHNNLCHHWLAEDVEVVQEPSPDSGEAIDVHLMTLDEVKESITNERFKHPLGLSAMSRVYPLWDLPFTPAHSELHNDIG